MEVSDEFVSQLCYPLIYVLNARHGTHHALTGSYCYNAVVSANRYALLRLREVSWSRPGSVRSRLISSPVR